ncbi:hypothetical protein NE848_07910 [Gramella jeungdoensis]|uniref:Uncharacterized protein n=1 Tax=Gramella jeungdoensis TaxID=708091 RepID=A0ABT0Z0Q9_9FLAO|nr:hypothetical protein [Gramella jeungdoensis]MCM8569300.1 hypothetical protein [Gramella jeungdoensis]
MKSLCLNLLALTTIVLVLLAVFSALGFPFPVLYFLMCFGQILLIFTVYKVLTDKYTTTKTFDDFYEDHPIRDE